jgi:hypothetical protein
MMLEVSHFCLEPLNLAAHLSILRPEVAVEALRLLVQGLEQLHGLSMGTLGAQQLSL